MPAKEIPYPAWRSMALKFFCSAFELLLANDSMPFSDPLQKRILEELDQEIRLRFSE
jgi:hypothetical protein